MLLILSNKWDVSVDFVVKECQIRGIPFLRLNTEDVLENKVSFLIDNNFKVLIIKNAMKYELNSCLTSVWCRRPGKIYEFRKSNLSDAVKKFVHEQWMILLEALSAIENVYWINDPNRASIMENKILQLKLAKKIGFNIPATIVSNSADDVREFFLHKKNKKIIVKALYSPLIEEENRDYFIFTNSINLDDLNEDEISVAPSIFQERLTPKRDYRVTVIGNTVLAVEIIIATVENEEVDWRKVENTVIYKVVDLPEGIASLCIEYVDNAGLVFGAIDLVQYNNDFYFIEINPSGEWGWLQKQINLPVAQSLCDIIERLANHHE